MAAAVASKEKGVNNNNDVEAKGQGQCTLKPLLQILFRKNVTVCHSQTSMNAFQFSKSDFHNFKGPVSHSIHKYNNLLLIFD